MKHLKFEEDGELNLPVQNSTRSDPVKAQNFKYTAALKPGVDWDGDQLEVTSEVYSEPVRDWDTLLTELGYDPDLYEVVEPVKLSSWDQQSENDTKRLYSYKVSIRTKRGPTLYRDEDYKDLVALIKKHRPMQELEGGDGIFFIHLADWQLGKADGDGTHGTVTRLLNRFDAIEKRIVELKKIGRKIQKIVICGMGDMEEGCDGNYPSQPFTSLFSYPALISNIR